MHGFPTLTIFCGLLLISQAAHSMSLREAFEAAKQSRAIVIGAQLEKKISEKIQAQALADVIPDLSIYSQNDWQDSVRGSDTTNRFGESYQHEAALEANQTVFNGGKEYLSLLFSGILKRQSEQELRLAEIQLYEEVAIAFYELLRIQLDLENLEEQSSALRRRKKVLDERAKIGKSKQTEVITALSEIARVKAESLKLKADHSEALRRLQALVDRDELKSVQTDLQVSEVPSLGEQEVLSSPQVMSKKEGFELAKAQSQLSLGNFLPTVEATGRYYLDRAGLLSDSKWDVGLTAEWEFFNGGRDLAERQIAELRKKQALVELNNTQKDQLKAFESEKENLMLRKESLSAFEEASRLAKRNYDSQQEEFKIGLVSNLDVLQALDTYLQAKRSRDEERVELKLSSIRLQLIAGQIP